MHIPLPGVSGKGAVSAGVKTCEHWEAANFPVRTHWLSPGRPSGPSPSVNTYQDPTTPAALPLTWPVELGVSAIPPVLVVLVVPLVVSVPVLLVDDDEAPEPFELEDDALDVVAPPPPVSFHITVLGHPEARVTEAIAITPGTHVCR